MPCGIGPRRLRQGCRIAVPVTRIPPARAPWFPYTAFLARARQGGYAVSLFLQSPERRKSSRPPSATSSKRRSLHGGGGSTSRWFTLAPLSPRDQAPSEHDRSDSHGGAEP